MEENIGEIVLKKARSDGIVMSRVPKPTRDAFIGLAESEFSGDYGMTLKYIFDNFIIWKLYFENIDLKLDKIINSIQLLNNSNIQPESKKMLSGRIIKHNGGKNE